MVIMNMVVVVVVVVVLLLMMMMMMIAMMMMIIVVVVMMLVVMVNGDDGGDDDDDDDDDGDDGDDVDGDDDDAADDDDSNDDYDHGDDDDDDDGDGGDDAAAAAGYGDHCDDITNPKLKSFTFCPNWQFYEDERKLAVKLELWMSWTHVYLHADSHVPGGRQSTFLEVRSDSSGQTRYQHNLNCGGGNLISVSNFNSCKQ